MYVCVAIRHPRVNCASMLVGDEMPTLKLILHIKTSVLTKIGSRADKVGHRKSQDIFFTVKQKLGNKQNKKRR